MSVLLLEELETVAAQLPEEEQKKLLITAKNLLGATIAESAYSPDFKPIELSDEFLYNELHQMRNERNRKAGN